MVEEPAVVKTLLKLRDWWRGYTEADVASVYYKVTTDIMPGKLTRLTPAEWRAWRALSLPRVVRARG